MIKLAVVHLPYSSIDASHWELKKYCLRCEGTKEYEEVQHGINSNGPYVDTYSYPCSSCDDAGQTLLAEIPVDEYECYEDLLDDYPNATSITKYIKENKS